MSRFGTSFGGQSTSSSTTKPAFGFGAPSTSQTGFAFGAAKTTAPTFSFGTTTTATTTTAATGFGFGSTGGFGTSTTSAAGSAFGFGSTAPTTSSTGFGFGTGFGGFGATKTTASSLFGGFGTNTSTTSSGFGLGGTSTSTGFGGFGTGLGGGLSTGFGTQQQQQQPQQGVGADLMSISSALLMPTIYGDERDAIIAKWNQLQAFWGTGKGYINQNSSVPFTPENPFCRFKTVGYSVKPTSKDEDGLVILHFKKKEEEIRSLQQQLVDALFKILGSKPTLSVCVEDVKQLPDDKTEVIIYIQERSPTGLTRRIPASTAFGFFSQANIKTQLGSLGVVDMVPKLALSEAQIDAYLSTPPLGYDPRLWRQAKLDNPDPEKLVPVPMVGFHTLKSRLENQEQQTKQHQARLDMINQDTETLQHKQTTIQAKIAEYKRRHLELSHRVLRILVRQETQRKAGMAIQTEEEQLRTRLEGLQAELNAPTQMKGRLNEMMSQIRLHSHLPPGRGSEQYALATEMQQEIRQHLKHQQEGLSHLIATIKSDLQDLKLIEQGLQETTSQR
ncbi:nuclear pore complex protein Nup54-like [Acanthaster planci]|uniref:54 kDa nucleoporin n=1 Tax=Acanthaster planci TaxID=133434 RepID=A0A8B7XH05_ACAPL|nr:nuclear pore complex protein Nup54-like [Acanthaster planci]XP_022079497.1 nuclear pore complex protein Nup54-like [Acanthaster planci]